MQHSATQLSLNTKYKYARNLAFGSFAALLIGGGIFLQPFSFTENTNATTERTTNGDYYIETTTTDLNLSINTTPAGAQETASHDVIVKTDDPAGFTLTVSVNNDTSNALNLNGSTSATEKFNATSGTYASPKALDDNTWGFADTLTKKNNDQWAAVPLLSSAQQIKQTSSATPSGDTTTVHYGIKAKYDGKHSNGNYSNTITYSVVGNTPQLPTALQEAPMQSDNIAELCRDATRVISYNDYTTYRVTDIRDSQEYYIRKFTFGGVDYCMMVEDLRLAGGSTVTYLDTNITANTITTLPSGSTEAGTYTLPSSRGYFYGEDQAMYYNGSSYYYNWQVAVAGTGGAYNTDMPSSGDICPRNWRLPTQTEATEIATFLDGPSGYKYNGNLFGADNLGNKKAPDSSGYYLYGQKSDYTKNTAYWWTSTQSSATHAYFLTLGSGSHHYTSLYSKYYGMTLRCLVQAAS